ncbi:MAG: hypothetical protein H7246_21110 [Phycisphaerae bacterium]|nr:hypothetical protein [Saprospiraceae bacterium]
MKKNRFVIPFFLLTFPLFAFCQEKKYDINPTENFLLLRNGTVLKEGQFAIKESALGEQFSYADGQKIKLADVNYYRTSEGYFGMYKVNAVTFRPVTRRATGTLELYDRTVSSVHYHGPSLSGAPAYTSRSSSNVQYFARPFGEIKIMNYKNLKEAFVFDPARGSQNKDILKHLNKGNTQKWSKYGLTIGGFGAVAAGMGMWLLGRSKEPPSSIVPALVVGGGGLVAYSIGSLLQPEKSYLKAMQLYNSNY